MVKLKHKQRLNFALIWIHFSYAGRRGKDEEINNKKTAMHCHRFGRDERLHHGMKFT